MVCIKQLKKNCILMQRRLTFFPVYTLIVKFHSWEELMKRSYPYVSFSAYRLSSISGTPRLYPSRR